MGADFSKVRSNALVDYAGVELKQGAVLLDADANELNAILDRRLRALAGDVLGRATVGANTPDAFRVAPGTTSSGAATWTFEPVAGTNLQTFAVTIRSQNPWLPMTATVTSARAEILSRSRIGRSPRAAPWSRSPRAKAGDQSPSCWPGRQPHPMRCGIQIGMAKPARPLF